MLVRTLLAALLAGILAGVLLTPVQYATTVPLILAAETYEGGGEVEHDHSALSLVTPAHAHTAVAGAGGEDEAAGRLFGTVLANVVMGAGLALVLVAASLALGVPITAANGAVFGLSAFAIVTLAPALGLPPELPAMPAAELGARQLWWLLTVAATAGGVYALAFVASPIAKVAGLAIMLVPHLLGAPHPADISSPVPPTLAAEFAVASLSVTALLWVAIGVIAGLALDRARRPEPLAA